MFKDEMISEYGIMAHASTHIVAALLFTSWLIAKVSWEFADKIWEYKISIKDVNSDTIPVISKIFTAMGEEEYQLCCKLEKEEYCFYVKEVEDE